MNRMISYNLKAHNANSKNIRLKGSIDLVVDGWGIMSEEKAGYKYHAKYQKLAGGLVS